jgi:putative transposase
MYVTKNQQQILLNWMNVYRYFYNKTVEYIKTTKLFTYKKCKANELGNYIIFNDEYTKVQKYGTHKRVYKSISLISLRKTIKTPLPDWVNDVPSHLIDEAIKEACVRYKTCLKVAKKFNMSFKTKRNIKQTFNMDSGAFSKTLNSFYPKFLGSIKTSEKFRKDLLGSSVSYHKVLKQWFINTCYKTPKKSTNPEGTCALDPGVKIFMSMYSPDEIIQFGTNASNVLFHESKKLDDIVSKTSKSNHRTRQQLRKQLHRQIKRIQNKRDDLHWKTINYLTLNYKNIILPDFKTSQMVSKLNSKVARSMNTLSFFSFKQRMITKCEERNINLTHANESYTSQTCTNCGIVDKSNINNNTRLYNCKKCNVILDRDIVGSRNILLKYTDFIDGKLMPKSIFSR